MVKSSFDYDEDIFCKNKNIFIIIYFIVIYFVSVCLFHFLDHFLNFIDQNKLTN